MHKRKILFHSNYPGLKTGFGGFCREILTYLYKTGKYELSMYAAGVPWDHKDFERWPWKTYGALPTNPQEIEAINRDPEAQRAAAYGHYQIDKVIQEVKPDVLVCVEDPWGIAPYKDKKWWNKFPCIVHTTLDSLPIVDSAIELSKKTPYFFSWADFATQAMNKMGLNNVKTLRGTVDTNTYRKLGEGKKLELRRRFQIPDDAFCVGMLSRNQLRKSFPNIIEGFAEFKKRNPDVKNPRLLLFTHFGEGWNIPKLLQDPIANPGGIIKPHELLCTYKCRATGRYYVAPFQGQDLNNPETGHEKSLITVNTRDGLTEEQVNEWYNLLDVYIHAFTSGGQERGIQEAKLCELVTLVTNYSCGEDNCVEEACSLALDWEAYREPNDAQFVKATTKPYSIVKQLEKFRKFTPLKKKEMGRAAREWVLKNFSIEVVGKQFEEILDNVELTNYNFKFEEDPKNPDAIIPEIEDNTEWLIRLYKDILFLDVHEKDEGVIYWLNQIKNGGSREGILDTFRSIARKDLERVGSNKKLEDILGPEAPEERILITMPKSLGDCINLTSLLENARSLYRGKKIYVATEPQFLEVFIPLIGRYIDYVLPWNPIFDNIYALEGYGGNKKYFQVILSPHFRTQRMVDYIHNGDDKTDFDLKA